MLIIYFERKDMPGEIRGAGGDEHSANICTARLRNLKMVISSCKKKSMRSKKELKNLSSFFEFLNVFSLCCINLKKDIKCKKQIE